jgi:hypothetical protein
MYKFQIQPIIEKIQILVLIRNTIQLRLQKIKSKSTFSNQFSGFLKCCTTVLGYKIVAKTTNRAIPNIKFNFEFSETRAQKCELAQQNSQNMRKPSHNL